MESLGARNAVVKTPAANKTPLVAKSSARGGAVVVRASARKDEEGNNKNTAVAGKGSTRFALPRPNTSVPSHPLPSPDIPNTHTTKKPVPSRIGGSLFVVVVSSSSSSAAILQRPPATSGVVPARGAHAR